jgi:hypothetical protein
MLDTGEPAEDGATAGGFSMGAGDEAAAVVSGCPGAREIEPRL